MSVLPLEDTGELRQLAEQLRRIEHDPRRPGVLDTLLLSIAIGAGIVVGVCLTVLAVAPDRFNVESGRVVLTMAAAGICIAPVLLGLYGVNRVNRRRYEEIMEKIDRSRCGCGNGGVADVDRLTKEAYDIGREVERRKHM